jgi:hypothetical protein
MGQFGIVLAQPKPRLLAINPTKFPVQFLFSLNSDPFMKYFRISIATAAIAVLLISCGANMDRTNQSFDNSPAPFAGTSTAPSSGSGYYAKNPPR